MFFLDMFKMHLGKSTGPIGARRMAKLQSSYVSYVFDGQTWKVNLLEFKFSDAFI